MSNPDYAALHQVAREPSVAVALDSLPLFRSLSAELRAFDAESGQLTIGFAPTEAHLQGFGAVAGGIVGTMLDFAMSLPVLGTLPPRTPFATVSYTINLIGALRPGPVLAQGRIERRGTRIAFTSARLITEDADARLVATGVSTLTIMETPPAAAF